MMYLLLNQLQYNQHLSFSKQTGIYVFEYALNWLKYHVLDDIDACESLLVYPSLASQYLTNVECVESIDGDINGDQLVNVQDIILAVNSILSDEYNSDADLNSDGLVNILDIVQIVNIILD